MTRTLAGPVGQPANDFQLLRTIAAAAVIVSHTFSLATGVADAEPFNRSGWTPGACAVTVFFGMSGFLIAGSFERHPGFTRFALARARRLFPAYFAALLFVVLGVGATATTLPLVQYLTHPATWRFLASNAVFDPSIQELPGVFDGNPLRWTVNGSLWSLRLEVLCYALLYVAGRSGLLHKARIAWFVAGALGATAILRAHGLGGPLPHVVPSFLTGMLLYGFREHVPASASLFVAFVAATWMTQGLPLNAELARAAIVYGAVSLATGSTRLGRRVASGGDYSYGLYLYGWPVTQMIVWALPGMSVTALLASTLPITAAVAVASWHWIERPVLRGRTTKAAKTAELWPTPAMG